MAHLVTHGEILAALESNAHSVAEYFNAQPDRVLFTGDPDRWGPAHHLVHLTMTSHAIARGLRSRPLPVHPTGRSRGYGEMIAAATASLAATPKERLRERGRDVLVPAGASRVGLVDGYVEASAEVRAAGAGWEEEDLDRRAMPHPLIGVLTVREMLLFCVFHERHHLKLVRATLGT